MHGAAVAQLRGQAAHRVPERPVVHIRAGPALALDSGANVLNIGLSNVSREVFEGELRLQLPPGLRIADPVRLPLRILPGRQRFLFLKLLSEGLPGLNGSHLVILLTDTNGREVAQRKVLLLRAENWPDGRSSTRRSPLPNDMVYVTKDQVVAEKRTETNHPRQLVNPATGEKKNVSGTQADAVRATLRTAEKKTAGNGSQLVGEGASVAENKISVGMHADSALVLQVGLNVLDLQLANRGDRAFAGDLRLDLPDGLRSLNGTVMPVNIPPKKKRFLSLKLTGGQLSKLKHAHLAIRLTDGEGQEINRRHVPIQVPKKRSVILQDNSDRQYVRHVGDSVQVKLRVANNGTTDERLRLVFSSPDRANNRSFKEMSLELPSGSDSVVRFSFVVEKHMLALPHYTVQASGMYADSDLFGHVSVPFSNMASDRDFRRMFRAGNQSAVYSGNYIDLEIEDALEAHRTYSLSSQGEYAMGDGKIRYHAHVGVQGGLQSPPHVGNTYLEYEKGRVQLGLGNVQESLEASLYGLGVKVSVRNAARSRVFSGGVVEKSSDLLGFSNGRSRGFSAFTRLVQGDGDPKRRHYDSQLYYDRNPMDSTESLLWSSSFDVLPSDGTERLNLRGFAGAGMQRFRADAAGVSRAKSSAAMAFKWSGKLGRWSYSGEEFFSTPYYTGNRRGLLQIRQSLSHSNGKFSYGAGGAFSRYAPKYFRRNLSSIGSSYYKLDLFAHIPFSPLLDINLNPSYNHKTGNYRTGSDYGQVSARSWLLAVTGNLRTRNHQHYLHAMLETGWVSVGRQATGSFGLRGNASYNYKAIGINTSYQKGAFQAFEVLNGRASGTHFGDRMSFGASCNGMLFDSKLVWRASAMANITAGYGHGYAAHANATYRLGMNSMLTGTFQYNYDQGTAGHGRARTNLRLGVRQNLKAQAPNRPVAKAGNLNVFCFYDNNSNGIFDEGDDIATDYGFMVRDILFVTDKKGRASFKKMPYGSYMLFFPMHKGYRGASRAVQMDRKQVVLAVPLQKVGTVRGRLMIDHDPKFSLKAKAHLDGYKIVAQDESGRTFEAYSREDGSFEMSLPQGRYTFSLPSDAFPENIFMEESLHASEVAPGKTVELAPFVLKVKRKKVEVKRF